MSPICRSSARYIRRLMREVAGQRYARDPTRSCPESLANWHTCLQILWACGQLAAYGDGFLDRGQGLFRPPQVRQPVRLVVQRRGEVGKEGATRPPSARCTRPARPSGGRSARPRCTSCPRHGNVLNHSMRVGGQGSRPSMTACTRSTRSGGTTRRSIRSTIHCCSSKVAMRQVPGRPGTGSGPGPTAVGVVLGADKPPRRQPAWSCARTRSRACSARSSARISSSGRGTTIVHSTCLTRRVERRLLAVETTTDA